MQWLLTKTFWSRFSQFTLLFGLPVLLIFFLQRGLDGVFAQDIEVEPPRSDLGAGIDVSPPQVEETHPIQTPVQPIIVPSGPVNVEQVVTQPAEQQVTQTQEQQQQKQLEQQIQDPQQQRLVVQQPPPRVIVQQPTPPPVQIVQRPPTQVVVQPAPVQVTPIARQPENFIDINNANTNTNTNTINVTPAVSRPAVVETARERAVVTREVPVVTQEVVRAQEVVQPVQPKVVSVAGDQISDLPKTGLPAVVWLAIFGGLPIALKLAGVGRVKHAGQNANSLWEERQMKKQ